MSHPSLYAHLLSLCSHIFSRPSRLRYHLLFFSLPVIRSTNSSVTLLSLPPQAITRSTSQRIHKIFFEELNTPAFCLVDSALVSAFAVGQMGACVVDVGWRGSTVSCVLDALLVPGSTRRCPVGMGECVAYLASQLAKDAGVVRAVESIAAASTSSSPSPATTGTTAAVPAPTATTALLLDLAEFLFREGEVSLGEADGAQDAAASGANGSGAAEDEGNFDVLGALTSGKEKEAIAEQERRNRALIEAGKEPEPVQGAGEGEGVGQGGVPDGGEAPAATTSSSDAQDTNGPSPTAAASNGTTLAIQFKGAALRIPRALLSDAVAPLTEPSLLASVSPEFLSVPPVPSYELDSDSDSDSDSPQQPQPLLPPADWSSAPSLPETIAASLSSLPDIDRRNPLFELLVLTGAPTHALKGLNPHIISSLSLFVASSGSSSSNFGGGGPSGSGMDTPLGMDDPSGAVAFPGAQPGNARALKTPDYFPEFKGRTDLAPFLGSTIYAKLVFADSQARGYTLKGTYSEKGPGVAFGVSASEK